MEVKVYKKSISLVPETLNEEERSFEAVIMSDAPAYPAIGGSEFPDIWLVDGLSVRADNGSADRVPIFDSHNVDDSGRRIKPYKARDVLGSISNFNREGGKLKAKFFFADTLSAKDIFGLYRDKHITDVSAGVKYRKDDVQTLAAGEEVAIKNKTYKGPANLHMAGEIFEGSTVLAGAISDAKILSKGENHMENEKQEKKTEEAVDVALNAAPPAAVDEKEISLNAQKLERERIKEITAMAKNFGISELGDSLIENGSSIDDARKAIMEKHLAQKENESTDVAVHVSVDEKDKKDRQIIAGMSARWGAGIEKGDEVQGNPYTSMTMMEVAKDRLVAAGVTPRGSSMEIAGYAMTSSDFPDLINKIANKTIWQRYQEFPKKWDMVAGVGSVSNYLQHRLVKKSMTGTLDKLLGESQNFPMGHRSDDYETYQADRYAKMFEYSKVMLVNDEFDIANIGEHGAAAARTVESRFWTYVASNPVMADGNAAASAAHANIAIGGDIGAPSIATFNAAELAMSYQLDIDGETPLNIMPEFFVASTGLKGYTTQFLATRNWSDEAIIGVPDDAMGSTRVNTWFGRLNEIYTAYIPAAATFWMFLGPKGTHFMVHFVEGQRNPIVETAVDFHNKNLQISIELSFALSLADYRYLYYNAG